MMMINTMYCEIPGIVCNCILIRRSLEAGDRSASDTDVKSISWSFP